MREAVDNFAKNKKGLALLNANTAYWQVRFDAKNPSHLIFYKGTPKNPSNDPIEKTNSKLVTTKFRHAPVNMPENQLFGIMYSGIPVEKFNDLPIIMNHWLLQGTRFKKGSVIPKIVGSEVGWPINGGRHCTSPEC
ncbi:hypothetical protein BCI9360_01423 [Bacillus sp. CECT 9360]|nr:N,N-dimethylformamidase beta subunit family domain-containing protein [Bacillus sp. CECT 9360]CAH0345144.1 hypothetical protein BCI9360_01423 [Bacillus sp. CECT 9360]